MTLVHPAAPAASRPSRHGRPSPRPTLAARGACAALIALLSALLPANAAPQSARRNPAADPLARVRVGDWVHLEGAVRKDLVVDCSEVRLLTGDFLDDDWSVGGTIRSIHAQSREFFIGPVRITVTNNTAYENPSGTPGAFSRLRPGMAVDVEGTYMPSGRFLAAEVDDETDEIHAQPGTSNPIQVVGRVERLDLRRRTIVVAGATFQLTAKTPLRSVIE